MTSLIPEGWGHEGPDESVGIFGDTFWHDACPKNDGEAESVHEEKWTGKVRDGHETVVHTLTCPDCGKRRKFTTQEFVGYEEEAFRG